jgi:hypothetical protein
VASLATATDGPVGEEDALLPGAPAAAGTSGSSEVADGAVALPKPKRSRAPKPRA